MTRFLCQLFAVLFVFTSPAFAEETAATPEVGPLVKAYKGPEQMKVSIVRFGPKEAKQALVVFEGIDHEWNGKVFKMNVSDDGNKYTMMVNHNPNYIVIALRSATYGGSDNSLAIVGLKDDRKEYQALYNEELSKSGKPQDILAKYLEQNKQP